jgi:N-acetylmuramoyl-L-alanine amidase CwlA
VIGLDGEIILCIPLNEISYASNDRNNDTISIECCHPDETGKFNDKTYRSLVTLVAWVCCKYNLDKKDIIRHYDFTGKMCPLYYVEHKDAWKKLKNDVMKYIDENAVIN